MFRYLVIVFAIAVVVNGPGVSVTFLSIRHSIKTQIKEEIEHGISESQLVHVADNASLTWMSKNREFRMGNRFYDVVKVKVIAGKRTYLCINDHEEEKLFAHLNDLVDQKMNNQKRSITSLLLCDFMNFLNTEKPNFFLQRFHEPDQQRVHIPYRFSVFKINLDILSPPPILFT